ncbi:MAG: hypothetical protein NZM05_10885 [Chloroherpetonaceae bacterium]|nr:hypothetical protein [Chloroherpetonaceae bacterium]
MKLKQEADAKAKLLLERLKAQPISSAALTLAESWIRQGKAKEALERLRAIEPYYKQSYRFAVLSARAYKALGNLSAAKQWYEKACALAPQNEVAFYELIQLSAPKGLGAMAATTAEPTKQADVLGVPSFAAAQESQRTIETTQPVPLKAHTISSELAQTTSPSPVAQTPPQPETPKVEAEATVMQSTSAVLEAKPEKNGAKAEEPEERLLTEKDIFNEKGEFIGEYGGAPDKELPEISFSPEPKPLPKYDTVLDLSKIPAPHQEPPVLENETPKVSLDKAKLAEVLSRISFGEERAAEKTTTPAKSSVSMKETQTAAPTLQTPSEAARPNGNIASEPTLQHKVSTEQSTVQQGEQEEPDELEALAAALSNIKPLPIEETNDPTPIAEQRKPFDDDEEIKTPTRQLAEIFVAQGAFAKAIKVYEALLEKEPQNAFLLKIIIDGLKAHMSQTQKNP